jgi:O-antigen/teichoic acid export membrane protein
MMAANWTLQLSIFVFAVNVISVPYNASIVAHEKMSAFAYISIFEVSLKLAIAYLLLFISYDKLIVYSILVFCVALLLRSLYCFYCKRHFEECHYTFSFNIEQFREMFHGLFYDMITGKINYIIITIHIFIQNVH